jgi:uncharacterized membrane protein
MEVLNHAFALVCGQNPGHTWTPGGMLLPCCQRCTGLYVGAGMAALLHFWLRPRLSARFLEAHGAFLVFMAPFGFHWLAHGPEMRTITGVLFGFAVVTFLLLPLVGGAREAAWSRGWPLKGERGTFGIQQPASNIQREQEQRPLDAGGSGLDVGSSRDSQSGVGEPGPCPSWGRGQEGSGAGGRPAPPRALTTVWAYFIVLAITVALLPSAAKLGSTFVPYLLSALIAWGGLVFAVLVAADVSLGVLTIMRGLRRLFSSRVLA